MRVSLKVEMLGMQKAVRKAGRTVVKLVALMVG